MPQILIPIEDHAKEIYEEIKIKGITKKLMREAGQYCINLYEDDCNKLVGMNKIRNLTEEIAVRNNMSEKKQKKKQRNTLNNIEKIWD